MDKVQNVMKNGKMREYLQVCHQKRSAGTDTRLGVESPGHTRWSSRNDQLARQIQSAQSDNAYIIHRARDYVNITLRLLASAQNSFGYSGELNQKSSVQLHTLA